MLTGIRMQCRNITQFAVRCPADPKTEKRLHTNLGPRGRLAWRFLRSAWTRIEPRCKKSLTYMGIKSTPQVPVFFDVTVTFLSKCTELLAEVRYHQKTEVLPLLRWRRIFFRHHGCRLCPSYKGLFELFNTKVSMIEMHKIWTSWQVVDGKTRKVTCAMLPRCYYKWKHI